jgi:predicted ATPase
VVENDLKHGMKIRQLYIEGFRSLKNVVWEPGDLNVLIGPNGSGKSNLLRALELVSVSAQGKLGKHVQDVGGMQSLVWDGEAPEIAVKVKTTPPEPERKEETDSLTYDFHLTRVGQTPAYRIERELLGNFYRVEIKDKAEPFKFLERKGQKGVVFSETQRRLDAAPELLAEDETLLSMISGPFFENRVITLFQKDLAAWSVYHDLRVDKDAPVRLPAVTRTERRVSPDGQNLISVLHTLYTGDRKFKKDINSAMKAAFGGDFEELIFTPAATDQKVQLQIRWKSLKREQSAEVLSDGTLRFLFLLTVLASPTPAPVIAIDEPEVGLHPGMLPTVAEHAVDASLRSQVILTTHSPQFLDAFRDPLPTTTVARWENGETELKTLEGKDLEYWLKDYTLGSLFKSGELEAMG